MEHLMKHLNRSSGDLSVPKMMSLDTTPIELQFLTDKPGYLLVPT